MLVKTQPGRYAEEHVLQTQQATITNRTNGRQVGEPTERADSDFRRSSCSGSASQPIAARSPGTSSWQLPSGVTAGNWDYITGRQIAENYDQFLAETPLTSADWEILDRYLPAVPEDEHPSKKKQIVADFGCGTGRHVLRLMKRGYQVVAVDLSLSMLDCLSRKSSAEKQKLDPDKIWKLQANLVELEGFKPNCIDHAICMFSTMGMINGRGHRQRFLQHVRRILKQDGQFILHVHNFWQQLLHPGGFSWLITNTFQSVCGRCELGVRNMFIHSFRKTELKTDLQMAGFRQTTWYGVHSKHKKLVESPSGRQTFQLVGWIVVCR